MVPYFQLGRNERKELNQTIQNMTSTIRRTLLSKPGMASLRSHLQANRASLAQSPILVVASEPAPSQPVISQVDEACKLVNFTLAQQLGLRTVPSTVSSAFPTTHDLQERLKLAQRTGAGSIVAVGSGTAVDLAKALAIESDWEQVIVVPTSYASMVAAGSSHSLFLDPIEEALVPIPSLDTTKTTTGDTPFSGTITVAPLEKKLSAPVDKSHIVYASIAIAVDTIFRDSGGDIQSAEELLKSAFAALQAPSEVDHELATSLLFQSGNLLSFGLSNEDRSITLSLASSLIPRIFPHVHVLTFWASLCPGLCQLLLDSQQLENTSITDICQTIVQNQELIPHLTVSTRASKELDGFSVPDMSLSHIQTNQTLWKCIDVPNSVLTQVLSTSLDR
jgi:hypothetical protein